MVVSVNSAARGIDQTRMMLDDNENTRANTNQRQAHTLWEERERQGETDTDDVVSRRDREFNCNGSKTTKRSASPSLRRRPARDRIIKYAR